MVPADCNFGGGAKIWNGWGGRQLPRVYHCLPDICTLLSATILKPRGLLLAPRPRPGNLPSHPRFVDIIFVDPQNTTNKPIFGGMYGMDTNNGMGLFRAWSWLHGQLVLGTNQGLIFPLEQIRFMKDIKVGQEKISRKTFLSTNLGYRYKKQAIFGVGVNHCKNTLLHHKRLIFNTIEIATLRCPANKNHL